MNSKTIDNRYIKRTNMLRNTLLRVTNRVVESSHTANVVCTVNTRTLCTDSTQEENKWTVAKQEEDYDAIAFKDYPDDFVLFMHLKLMDKIDAEFKTPE